MVTPCINASLQTAYELISGNRKICAEKDEICMPDIHPWFNNKWPYTYYDPFCAAPEVTPQVLKLFKEEVCEATNAEDIVDASMLVVGPTWDKVYGAMTFMVFEDWVVDQYNYTHKGRFLTFAFVFHLGVLPEHRNHGLGRFMLGALMHYLSET